jgi:peptidase M66-like protein
MARSSRGVGASVMLIGAFLGCSGPSRNITGPAVGTLHVTVAGLAGGATARLSVTGPGGYFKSLTGPGFVDGLLTGVYTVEVLDVTSATQSFHGSAVPASASIVAGDTSLVAVTYVGGPLPTLDLTVAGITLVQSVQRPDNSVALVTGRDAAIRVFVLATETNTAAPAVRVRLFQGATLTDSLTIAAPRASVPTALDTASLTSTWNGVIPGTLVSAGLGVEVEVDPENAVAEAAETDNVYPLGGVRFYPTVLAVPPLDVRFVPVRQSATNLTGNVTNANRDALLDFTTRVMPLGAVTSDVRAIFTTSTPPLASNDSNSAWGQILSEIYALRTADGSQRNYLGIVAVNYGSGIAGYGYLNQPAAVGWDKPATAPGVLAHELGHNFGRNHAPCGSPPAPDPDYPYPSGLTGAWGFDVAAMEVKSPLVYADLMGYCNPDWISDYTYEGVMGFRGTLPGVGSAARRLGTSAGPGLLLWGRVRESGQLVLEPAFRVVAPARLPAAPGRFRVIGTSVAGGQVFSISFDGDEVADLPGGGERHFAFVVPLSDADLASVGSLRLEAHGLSRIVAAPASLTAPGAAPAAPPTGRRVGRETIEVRWDRRYPMAILRDGASREVVGFARGGRGTVIAPSGRVIVEVSEGPSSARAGVVVPQ